MSQQEITAEPAVAGRWPPRLRRLDALARTTRGVRDEAVAWAARTSRLDLVVLVTLVLLIEGGPGRPVGLVHLIAFAGILYRPLTRRPAYWLLLVALWLVVLLPVSWTSLDNHQWLIVYWCLALGLSMRAAQPLQVLATNARLMIALVFVFATAWKVASPDFPDGGFFHFTLVTDERFAQPAEVVGGLPEGATAQNGAAIDAWDDPTAAVAAATLQDGPRVAAIAQFMAIATIALEGLVAASFLAPDRWRLSRAREVLLLVFVLVTYPVAPVISFGWLLVAMGLAQSRVRRPLGDLVYVAAFLAIYSFVGVDRLWGLARQVLGG